jgi:hypothetical protein
MKDQDKAEKEQMYETVDSAKAKATLNESSSDHELFLRSKHLYNHLNISCDYCL